MSRHPYNCNNDRHPYNWNNDDDAESSIAFDLLSCVDDDGMTDIVLIASDGERIPASRFVLGARSSVLRQVLFQEKGDTCNLKYSGIVVNTLVEYCRTNDIMDLARSIPKNPAHKARELVHLEQCARFFEMPGLQKRTCDLVTALLQNKEGPYYSLAVSIFDEATKVNKTGAVKKLAFKAIQARPQEALLNHNQMQAPGVSSLTSRESLEEIVSNPELNCEEITVFRALLVWSECTSSINPALSNKKRIAIVKSLVQECVDLSRIAPSDLVGIVTASQLIEQSTIWVALKDTALRSEAENEVPLFALTRKKANRHREDCKSQPTKNRNSSARVLKDDDSVQASFDDHRQRAFEPAQGDDFQDMFNGDDRKAKKEATRPYSPPPENFEDVLGMAPATPSRGKPSLQRGSPSRGKSSRNNKGTSSRLPKYKPPPNLLPDLDYESDDGLSQNSIKQVTTPTRNDVTPTRNDVTPTRNDNNFAPTHIVNEKDVLLVQDVNNSPTSVVETGNEVPRQRNKKKGKTKKKGRLVLVAEALDSVCMCGNVDTTFADQ